MSMALLTAFHSARARRLLGYGTEILRRDAQLHAEAARANLEALCSHLGLDPARSWTVVAEGDDIMLVQQQ